MVILWGLIAVLVVAVFYSVAAYAHKEVVKATGKSVQGAWYNPLVITAGVFGRASLSNLQIFGFFLVVLWALSYHLLKDGKLSDLSADVLFLLGIGALGTAGAKLTAVTRKRLSSENHAWLLRKKWIKNDVGKARRPPKFSDLITSDDAFDVFKFQTLTISFVVAVALVMAGLTDAAANGLENFELPKNFLELLGLSQAANVGGKAIAPPTIGDLERCLTKVRDLEREFAAAVWRKWNTNPPPGAGLNDARMAAPVEHDAYMKSASEAAEILKNQMGKNVPPSRMDPEW